MLALAAFRVGAGLLEALLWRRDAESEAALTMDAAHPQ